MKPQRTTKLKLSIETLGQVAGAAWHRTSIRCHETYVSACYQTQCQYTCFCSDGTCFNTVCAEC